MNLTYKEINKLFITCFKEKYGSNSHVCLFFDHLSFPDSNWNKEKYAIFQTILNFSNLSYT